MELALLILNCALTAGVLAYLLMRHRGGMAANDDLATAAAVETVTQQMQRHAELLGALETRLRDELRRSEKAGNEAALVQRDEQRAAATSLRDEQRQAAAALRTELDGKFAQHLRSTLERLEAVRATLEVQLTQVRDVTNTQLTKLSVDNQRKLDEMRGVVDEKLQATLQTRLGEAFKQVSDRLEQVHKGLGEMQSIAVEVGGLKRVLSNVKARGILGEVQLETILEQFLTPDQMARNVETAPGSGKRVEFAVRMPGQDKDHPVWLPIDSKFSKEDYERLLDAHEAADRAGVDIAAAALAARLHGCAKDIREKYVDPPNTTDFALLFLPTEGLYAEALRQPGLTDQLQHDYRVIVAGPTTLAALLQSLQMGFRTLALEKRSSEVWTLLGAVKTQFGLFGEVLDKARSQLERAATTLESTGRRTRAIERKLRDVQELPSEQAALLLPPAAAGDDDDSDDDAQDARKTSQA